MVIQTLIRETTSGESTFEQLRDVPLASLIREQVLASILRGDILPGQRITEPAIAEKLGVSRVPVREALRELTSIGMLESRKHTGVFVRQLTETETADLYELRAVLDAFAGKLAAGNPVPKLIKNLKTQLADMDKAAKAANTTQYYEANLRFHWAIVSATENEQFMEVYRGVVQKLHLARLTNLSSPIGVKHSIREHRSIYDAIRKGKPDECEALMAEHVKAARARLFQSTNRGELHANVKNS